MSILLRTAKLGLVLGTILAMGACRGGVPEPATATPQMTISLTPTALPTTPPPSATAISSATETLAFPNPPPPTQTMAAYPAPLATATPAPIVTAEGSPYPAPLESVPQQTPTLTEVVLLPLPYPGPAQSPTPSTGTPTSKAPDPVLTATPSVTASAEATISVTPTERLAQPVRQLPASGTTVSIWHSWTGIRLQALETIITAYQDMFPDVSFDLLYVPFDELRHHYVTQTYQGDGPSILIGMADWGAEYADLDLVADLSPYASAEFLALINPAALDTAIYRDKLISLPYAQRGTVLYRNKRIVGEVAATFDELVEMAQTATHTGNVGAYLEIGVVNSDGHLFGLGGELMDEDGNPLFNTPEGVAWLDLLSRFEQAGPVSFNDNQDLILFTEGRAGLMIGSSQLWEELAEAIGSKNLAIDPWPAYGEGRLAGLIQAESLFLNPELAGEEQLSALRFMGYFLHPSVQELLAEVGFIPAVSTAEPRNPFIKYLMNAFQDGYGFPLVPDERILFVYWSALDAAIRQVVEEGVAPELALNSAYEDVSARLVELQRE